MTVSSKESRDTHTYIDTHTLALRLFKAMLYEVALSFTPCSKVTGNADTRKYVPAFGGLTGTELR